MTEVWREIPEFEGKILVSDQGRVRSFLRDDRILKPCADKKGYLRIRITYKRKKFSIKVHRAVAKAFISNENPNKTQVNHKDGNKKNNCAENLEWVSNKENADHAIKNGLWENVFKASRKATRKQMIPVFAKEIKSGKIYFFESISSAEKFCGTRHICDCLNGKRSKSNGFVFFRKWGDRPNGKCEDADIA